MPGEVPDVAADYGLRVDDLRTHPGGFDSDCLVADGTWFIKIWRGGEPPARLDLLTALRAAGLPVPAPIAARTGELHSWWRGRPYAVFPYVAGRTADDDTDWRLTAQALRSVHDLDGIALPQCSMAEPEIRWLRDHLDHPWIAHRRRHVADNILRLERTIERAKAKAVPYVVCHRDFGGTNLLVDRGRAAAILDWEQAVLAPREHDVWIAAEGHHATQFLTEYGATDLDPDHLEYAPLARALRDMAVRVQTETDRPGVQTWGFARIARLDHDLTLFRPFCA